MNSYIDSTTRKRKQYMLGGRQAKKIKKSHVCEMVHKNDSGDEKEESDGEEHGANPFAALMKPDDKVDMKDNHIYFRSDVNRESTIKLTRIISGLNKDIEMLIATCKIANVTPKPLVLHITSYGGDLLYGYMAYDAIKRSKIPIHTIIEGYAFSSGTVMSMAGVKRFATPNSIILVHQLSASEEGTFEQLKDQTANHALMMKKLREIYLKSTKMKSKELDQLLKRDLMLDVEQSLKYGLIDDVYVEDV